MRENIDGIILRIQNAGLAFKNDIIFCLNREEIYGKHNIYNADLLKRVTCNLNRDVMLVCTPAEPYRTVIAYLTEKYGDVIYPGDYETRLLLSDLPVIPGNTEQALTSALRKRRGAVFQEGDVIVASRNLRMAYVTFSAICFACFVKFFSDYLHCSREGFIDDRFKKSFKTACKCLDPLSEFNNSLLKGPFTSVDDVLSAIGEAGKLTVASRLVDASFGNISFCKDKTLYITRTGTYLDELHGFIDAVDIESPDEVPATVSSEFPVHREIVMTTGRNAVLHGHPKFAVILSMACGIRDCIHRDSCQTMCPHERYVAGIPVVPGVSGTGPYGLCYTLPPAMKHCNTVIVYGHGLFAAGTGDFNEAYASLLSVERKCRLEYFNLVMEK